MLKLKIKAQSNKKEESVTEYEYDTDENEKKIENSDTNLENKFSESNNAEESITEMSIDGAEKLGTSDSPILPKEDSKIVSSGAPKIKLSFGGNLKIKPPRESIDDEEKANMNNSINNSTSKNSTNKKRKKRKSKARFLDSEDEIENNDDDGDEDREGNFTKQKRARKDYTVSNSAALSSVPSKANKNFISTISLRSKDKTIKKLPRLKVNHHGSINAGNKNGIPRIKVKAARQPGNGYDSEAPDREEDPLVEEAIVLRMNVEGEDLDYLRDAVTPAPPGSTPEEIAKKMEKLSNVSIKWIDSQAAIVNINDHLYVAKLVELPTVTEIHKTIDKKTIFKVADVCQMLIISSRVESEEIARKRHMEEASRTTLAATSKHGCELYPHGITPPLYYARKRRFRKRISHHTIEAVEAQVNRLLQLDEEAESISYELIDQNAFAREASATPFDTLDDNNSVDGFEEEAVSTSGMGDTNVKLEELEEDELSKALEIALFDENENDSATENDPNKESNYNASNKNEEQINGDKKDAKEQKKNKKELKSIQEENREGSYSGEKSDKERKNGKTKENKKGSGHDNNGEEDGGEGETAANEDDDEDDDDYDDEEEEDDDDEEDDEVEDSVIDEEARAAQQQAALLREEISELEQTIKAKERDAQTAINPILRGRFMDVVTKLRRELEAKKALLEESDSSGGHTNDNKKDKSSKEEEED